MTGRFVVGLIWLMESTRPVMGEVEAREMASLILLELTRVSKSLALKRFVFSPSES